MNILYIDHYAGSPEMGMEFRPYYFAREWQKMGHKVLIVAGDYSHLRRENPQISHDFEHQEIEGVDYLFFQTGEYEGNGVSRALTMERFCRKLLRHAKRIADAVQPDVVIASSTYPLDTYPARRIAKLAGARLIHEVHDMWPATPKELGGMSSRHPFVVVMQTAENAAYKHSDYVVSLLPYAKDYMVEHHLAPEKFVNIQNGVYLPDWEERLPLPEEHEQALAALKGKFLVGYFGGHALSNALDTLLDAAAGMQQDNVHFVLVGDGVEKPALMARAEREGLENVTFLPPVDKRAVPSLIEHFDCAYLGALDSPLYRFGMSMNKVYDAMMAGKPVVCAITTPGSPVSETGCGICLESGDVSGIIKAIRTLAAMSPEEREAMGRKGKDAVLSEYEYSKLAERFAALFSR